MRERTIKARGTPGGVPCQGKREQWRTCNSKPCPSKFEHYKQEKEKYAKRQYKYQVKNKLINILTSRMNSILGDCTWEEFSHWDTCSKSCGGGQQSRSRRIRQNAAYGGHDCIGALEEVRTCNTAACEGM